jgi:Cd2+/Zn2+-exporting ATPase/Cu+-exporting ATPase
LLSSVDTVVFDKTGTMTFGNPELTSIVAAEGHTESEVLELAAIAEQKSEHPLGRAISNHAAAQQLRVPSPETFKYIPAKGIQCSLDHSEILVGNRAFLQENGVSLDRNDGGAHVSSEYWWPATESISAPSALGIPYGRKRRKQSLRFTPWAYEPSF